MPPRRLPSIRGRRGAAPPAAGIPGEEAGAAAAWLWAYQAVLVLVAIGLFADLLWGRWTQAAITGLVVELGELEEAGTLRARLARAVGDPSLLVAYRLPDADGYVDEAGRPVALPAAGAGRTVTYLQEGGRQIGALVHDAAVLDDPDLVSAVAAAAGVAVANARLQAELGDDAAAVGLEPGGGQVVGAGASAVQGGRGTPLVVSHGAHTSRSDPGQYHPDRAGLQPPAAPGGAEWAAAASSLHT